MDLRASANEACQYVILSVYGVIVSSQRFYRRNADIMKPSMHILVRVYPNQARPIILIGRTAFEVCKIVRAFYRRVDPNRLMILDQTTNRRPLMASKSHNVRRRRNQRIRKAEILLMRAEDVNILEIS
jgi:hypothetical protein